MPGLKQLSGKEIIKILERLGFTVAGQRGSHVRLMRITTDGSRQRLTIPLHHEIARKTVSEIYRQVIRYVPEEDAFPLFHNQ